jgi:hypothetical protein
MFTKDVINGRRSVGEKGEYDGDIAVSNNDVNEKGDK